MEETTEQEKRYIAPQHTAFGTKTGTI